MRPPLNFWRHYPEIDERPDWVAEAIVPADPAYDLDFVKMMPSGLFSKCKSGVAEWGIRTRTLRFKRLLDGPHPASPMIGGRSPSGFLTRVPADASSAVSNSFARPCPRRSFSRPVLPSPLTTAAKLAGRDLLLERLFRCEPEVMAALEAVARTEETYIAAGLRAGCHRRLPRHPVRWS